MGQAVEWFGLEGVGRSAARFDPAKLEHLNGHYLRESPLEELAEAITERLRDEDRPSATIDDTALSRITAALPHLTPRAKTLVDLTASAIFLVERPTFPLAEAKAAKMLSGSGSEVLRQILPTIEAIDDWQEEVLDRELRAKGAEMDLGFGKLAQPLRAALTGSTASPGIFDVMVILGKDETLARLKAVPAA